MFWIKSITRQWKVLTQQAESVLQSFWTANCGGVPWCLVHLSGHILGLAEAGEFRDEGGQNWSVAMPLFVIEETTDESSAGEIQKLEGKVAELTRHKREG